MIYELVFVSVLFVVTVKGFLDIPLILNNKVIPNQGDTFEKRARQILSSVPLVDGHNDLAWHSILAFKGHLDQFDLRKDSRTVFPWDQNNLRQTDIPRIRKGQLGAQFWSAYTSCKFQYKDSLTWGMTVVDLIKRMIHKYSDVFQYVQDADGIMPAFRSGKVASLIGLESGQMIDSNLAVLRMFYELGVRYMTLTWSCDNPWADSYNDTRYNTPNHHGLTLFGEKVVREMNRLGMMVDLAHVAIDTMWDSINVSTAPVIFSHSSSYSLCPHHRNVPDDVAKAMTAKDGIIMINFYPNFINCTMENKHVDDQRSASISQVADHFDHFRNLIGSQYLGVGADFDGADSRGELADVSTYPLLFTELLRRGWSETELENVAFRNIHRVFKKVEQGLFANRSSFYDSRKRRLVAMLIGTGSRSMVRDSLKSQSPDDSLIDQSEIPDLTCRSQPKSWV